MPDANKHTSLFHHDAEGKSAAIFCHQVAALVPDMFCNFYSVKNHEMAKNSTTTKAGEKMSTNLEFLEFQKSFGVCLTKFKNNQILLHKKILSVRTTFSIELGEHLHNIS